MSYELRLPDFSRAFIIRQGDGDFAASRPVVGVPKFDPVLGTLVDVTISFDYRFELEAEIEADDILNRGLAHSASFTAGRIALGVGFTGNAQDPPADILIGDTIDDLTVACQGNAGAGQACTDTVLQMLVSGSPETSVAGSIRLDDFIGTGSYDGFSCEFEVIQPSLERNNVASAIAEVNGDMSTETTTFTITYYYGVATSDDDSDGVADFADNCLEVPNPAQVDTDGDNIGNACDTDTNNDCIVNFSDLGDLRAGFFGSEPVLDFNGDGFVNFVDLGPMKDAFFQAPGPSGVPNACSTGTM